VVALVALRKIQKRRRTVTKDSLPGSPYAAQPDTQPSGRPQHGMEPKATPMRSCPVCLSEFPTRDRFCVRDGAELMEGSSSGPFTQGMICPTCRRGYPFDARFCPEDADQLVPYGLYGAASATRPPLRLDTNKICPECGIRHAAAHLFCGDDGTQLVVVN
jgi:predicted nucleic acid-binding Zn ribbon protein